MNRLEKYPKYKDSGVEWLGEIPEEWKVKKLKFLGKIYAGLTDKKGNDFSKNKKGDLEPFIPFTNIFNNVVINDNEFQYVRIKKNEYQNIVQKGDILFLMSSETLEDIGKTALYNSNTKVFLNSFCKGFNVKQEKINSYYLNWLLQSNGYRTYFSIVGRGFTRINIKQDYVNNLLTILPPQPEQIKIANYLDKKTAQIDNAISLKEQMIERLKERRQIIINEAVTKGLDKTVTMKDSGVEWIDEIPEGWEVKKLKYILKINNGQDYKHIVADDGYPVIGSGGEFAKASEYLYDGEVLLLGRKGTINKPLYFIGKFWTVDTMFYAVVKNEYITKFMYYSSLSIPFNYYSTSTALPSMTQFNLNNHQVSIPSKQEQQEIIDFIENQISKIDNVIDLQQKQIDKLKEYKTSLIEAIVTGKVRVCDE